LQLRGVTVARNEIFVADVFANAIDVFPLTASGNVAPIRRIVGSATQLNGPNAVAVVGEELYVVQQEAPILVFPLRATGDRAPIRTYLPESSLNQCAAIDNGDLYVTHIGGGISVFPVVGGDVTGVSRSIGGASAGMSFPRGIVIQNGEIFVADSDTHQIMVFSETADGDVPPLRTIGGSSTGLQGLDGLSLLHDELYVVNVNDSAIAVFPAGASGDVAPTRTIAGSATGLTFVSGVFAF
jgi:hypothetical protein